MTDDTPPEGSAAFFAWLTRKLPGHASVTLCAQEEDIARLRDALALQLFTDDIYTNHVLPMVYYVCISDVST